MDCTGLADGAADLHSLNLGLPLEVQTSQELKLGLWKYLLDPAPQDITLGTLSVHHH